MNQAFGTKLDEERELVPEGEYLAQVDRVEEPQMKTSQKGNTFWTQTLLWSILDQAVLSSISRDKATVRQQIFLDFNDDGSFATGKQKNIAVGQINAALGMNDGTGSPARWVGGTARVKVSHRSDERNPERKYVEIVRVAKA